MQGFCVPLDPALIGSVVSASVAACGCESAWGCCLCSHEWLGRGGCMVCADCWRAWPLCLCCLQSLAAGRPRSALLSHITQPEALAEYLRAAMLCGQVSITSRSLDNHPSLGSFDPFGSPQLGVGQRACKLTWFHGLARHLTANALAGAVIAAAVLFVAVTASDLKCMPSQAAMCSAPC
jgi:hypothetical protein